MGDAPESPFSIEGQGQLDRSCTNPYSLKDVPPELAEEIRKLEGEALKTAATDSASAGLTSHITTRKTVSVFRIKDASGKEQVYHSLEEMPPDLRAAVQKAART